MKVTRPHPGNTTLKPNPAVASGLTTESWELIAMSNTPGRPLVMGTRGVITSGHYLASAAGFRIMEMGGNAVDAAAAVSFCLNLLEPHQNGLGGEVPMLIYSPEERRVYSVSGMGWSPAEFTIDWCREHDIELIPGDGYLPACVPAMVGTWALALARFGTMSFGQVLAPAIELAESGFPMYPELRSMIAEKATKFREVYPSSASVYLPNDSVPEVGDIFRNPGFAETLRILCRAEEAAKSASREAGIEAACDAFYRGEIAERIVELSRTNPVLDGSGKAHGGLLSVDDFAGWRARIEEPVTVNYRGLDVFKCSSWTQGPVFLQQLTLLEGFDLAAMGNASAGYIHTLMECAKLAFADREAYYGDPLFDDVPFDVLLSKDYADRRRALIGSQASLDLRPGDVGDGIPDYATFDVAADNRAGLSTHNHDTTQLTVIDSTGLMISATPSGGWIQSSPVIEGLGFPLGTRGQMFYLNAGRPNALAPHKRPRATLTPTIVTCGGEPYLAFGTPGGDSQDQWTLQFFVNVVDFGMDIQEALDAPHFHTTHFPSSFYPRTAFPGAITVDTRVSPEVIEDLKRMGHKVSTSAYPGLRMQATRIDTRRGVISGGVCSNPVTGYAISW